MSEKSNLYLPSSHTPSMHHSIECGAYIGMDSLMCSCLAGGAHKWLDSDVHKALDGTGRW